MNFYVIYPLCWLVGRLPRFMKRWLRSFVYVLLYRWVKYRVEVVRDNLNHSFAELSEEQRLDIERKFYRHLADIFMETISMASISTKKIYNAIEYVNADQIEDMTEGRSWIAAMAHYGSWEYTVNWGLHSRHNKVYAVYHPLKSRAMNRYFLKVRSRFGVTPIAMKDITRLLYNTKDDKEHNVTIAMIADQTAPGRANQHWEMFLGRMAPFFNGIEKFALKFEMPVAFMHIDKFENEGKYRAWLEVIYDGKEEVEEGEITSRYVAKLEAMIRKRPELWMWSHRRWKHKYRNE